jgi:hypothetical protein
MGNQSSKSHKDKYRKNVHWKSAGSNEFSSFYRHIIEFNENFQSKSDKNVENFPVKKKRLELFLDRIQSFF